MIDFGQMLLASVHDRLAEDLNQRLKDKKYRDAVVTELMTWLTDKARKKPVADLPVRLERVRKQLEKSVENFVVKVDKNKIVVTAEGSAYTVLRMFRLGTDWFEACPDIAETVLVGLFNDEK